MYASMGLVQLMEPDTEELMQERAAAKLIDDEFDSPHSRPWFVSYHASEFPGDRVDACKRYLLYRMMNIPPSSPMPPWVTECGEIGKAGEISIANAWYEGGRLLAVPEDPAKPEGFQLGFVIPQVWMTASTDLPVLKKGWTKPYIVEVKGKADEVLDEMISGVRKDGLKLPNPRGPDIPHTRQLRATIGAARLFDWGEVCVCEKCWRILAWTHLPGLLGIEWNEDFLMPAPWSDGFYFCPWCHDYNTNIFFKLDPPDCGEIYYWSRSWPRKTKSFFYEHDPHFFESGLEVLGEAKQHYLNDELPARPDHFQWSSGPCGYCTHKPHCRLDAGLLPRKRKPDPSMIETKLSESNAITYAKTIRPHYDFKKIFKRVIEEWETDA
jgi:hypothetical protein